MCCDNGEHCACVEYGGGLLTQSSADIVGLLHRRIGYLEAEVEFWQSHYIKAMNKIISLFRSEEEARQWVALYVPPECRPLAEQAVRRYWQFSQ